MKPGISKISMPEYLSIRALSSGIAHTLLSESPLHAKHAYDNPEDDPSDASDMGAAIHSALLEGVDLIIPLDYPDWRTKEARTVRDQVRADGKIPMLMAKARNVEMAVMAIKEQLPRTELRGAFESGAPEQTVVWDESGLGVGAQATCKARPDWLSNKWHISVKTTEGSARPDAWIRRQLGPQGYDTSLAFYERGLRTLGWEGQSRILVAQQNPPYSIVVIALAPSRQQFAEARVDRAVRTWQQCMASGKWPGYSALTHFAELEPWAEAEEYEIVQRGGEFDSEAAMQL